MKRSKGSYSLIGRVTMLALCVGMIFIVGYGQENGGGGRLAGTWDANVTVRNCATEAAILSFQSTANFNQGGTYSGITAGSSPAARSSERGVWAHLSGNQYRFRFKAYLFNAAGQATGYQVVTHDVELDQDNLNYTSAGISEIFTLSGTPVSTGCSTTVATRMTLN